MTAKTVAITGASGLVGSELVRHFSAQGWQVRALVRNPDRYKATKSVVYMPYDMTSPLAENTLANVDYVIHAAYVKQDKQHPDAFDINIAAAKNLLQATRKHHVARAIFMSSMSARSDALSTYGKQKYEIERFFNLPATTIIRSGLVIGNGGLIQQIVRFMRSKHVVPLIDGGDQPIQTIAVDDLALAVQRILELNVSGTLTIGTSEVYSYRELYLLLREKLRIKALLLTVPFFAPLYVIRLIQLLHLPIGVTEDNLWGLKQLEACETLFDLEKLGISPKPLDVILETLVIT